MIDTVTIFSPAEMLQTKLPTHWKHSTQSLPDTTDREGVGITHKTSFSFDDPSSGYHAYGNRDEVRYHRASLPRLLRGHNGALIKSQEELDTALELLQQNAGKICNAHFGVSQYTRVDLVQQFRGDTTDFILAHRNAKHPRIQKGPCRYESRSIAFEGSEMRINMYDKCLQRHGRIGDVVRIEVQLKGRILKELLGGGNKVTHLDFGTCYQAYRQIMLGFLPSPLVKAGNIAEFLAIGEREGWESHGIPAFDLYTRRLCKKQVYRLRRDMAVCRPEIFKIDWSQLLPLEAPPEAVEVGLALNR